VLDEGRAPQILDGHNELLGEPNLTIELADRQQLCVTR
jgi:hypothetical protein